MELIASLFERALNLEPPWTVKKIDFDGQQRRLNIFIDFSRGSVFPCPTCHTPSKAYDTTEKQWSVDCHNKWAEIF